MYCPFIGIILILYFLARLSYFGYMRHKYILYVFIYLHKIYLCIVGDLFVAEENWMLIGGIRNGKWTLAVDLLLPMDEVGAIKYNFTAVICFCTYICAFSCDIHSARILIYAHNSLFMYLFMHVRIVQNS